MAWPIEERHTLVSGGRLLLSLPAAGAAVGMAREAVDLLGFSCSPELREDAQLVVSELVSNGLEHGTGGVTLSLAVSEQGRLSGEVVDDGDGFEPGPPKAGARGRRGRGLAIVAALSEQWGVQEGTTRVWFVMPPVPNGLAG